jgi:hypothetical protein
MSMESLNKAARYGFSNSYGYRVNFFRHCAQKPLILLYLGWNNEYFTDFHRINVFLFIFAEIIITTLLLCKQVQ